VCDAGSAGWSVARSVLVVDPGCAVERVLIVYNPHSSGDGQTLAERLREELADRRPELPVQLQATQHAGQGREIARAVTDPGTVVVSASGDGGYHDVVNGLMDAGSAGVLAAVLAAGNANDHRRATGRRPLVEAIIAGDVSRLDLMRVTYGEQVEYAHSYVGWGLTPLVAMGLESGGKGSLRELVTAVRTFWRFHPFTIRRDQRVERFDSILCATIDQMAKYATLSTGSRPDDGRFEVIVIPHVPKWRIAATVLRAATRGLPPQPSVSSYRFTTVDPLPMQIDGELRELGAGDTVLVEIAPRALATLR